MLRVTHFTPPSPIRKSHASKFQQLPFPSRLLLDSNISTFVKNDAVAIKPQVDCRLIAGRRPVPPKLNPPHGPWGYSDLAPHGVLRQTEPLPCKQEFLACCNHVAILAYHHKSCKLKRNKGPAFFWHRIRLRLDISAFDRKFHVVFVLVLDDLEVHVLR